MADKLEQKARERFILGTKARIGFERLKYFLSNQQSQKNQEEKQNSFMP